MKISLEQHVELTDEAYALLEGIGTEKVAKKNAVVLEPGKAVKKMFFLKKGLMRGYKWVDGKEYTHHFYSSGWFATDFHSFLTGAQSELHITCLEECTFVEFNKSELERAYESSHSLERLGRVVAEKAYLATVEKLANMQLHNLAEKYELLIRSNPEIIQRVPQKYIASYLGVSEQSLSRIKRQVLS